MPALVTIAAAVAATTLSASATTPARGACIAVAPPVGGDAAKVPGAVDGTRFRSLHAVARARVKDDARALVVVGGDFTGQRAPRRGLANTCFVGAKLMRSDWRRANAPGIGFIRADLTGAMMGGAVLSHVLLRESTLADVDATGADFSGGRLDGGWEGSLARLRLDRAKLIGFNVICGQREVDGCPFDRSGLSVDDADFTRANLASFTFWDTVLSGAILNQTRVGIQQVGQLRNLKVEGPIYLHSPRRVVTLEPRDYTALRDGVTLLAGAGGAAAANNDAATCATITDRHDRAVCLGGRELRDLATRVKRAPRSPADDAILREQQGFCVNLSDDLIARCLTRLYRAAATRAVAQPVLANPTALTGSALFATLPVRFGEELRRTPLFTRVLPVFLDVAPTQIFAIVDNGTLTLSGGSRDGCAVSASGLIFDDRSGWYGRPVTTRRMRAGRTGRRATTTVIEPVVRFDATGLEFAAGATDVVTCRDGARLLPARRMDVSPAFVEFIAELDR